MCDGRTGMPPLHLAAGPRTAMQRSCTTTRGQAHLPAHRSSMRGRGQPGCIPPASPPSPPPPLPPPLACGPICSMDTASTASMRGASTRAAGSAIMAQEAATRGLTEVTFRNTAPCGGGGEQALAEEGWARVGRSCAKMRRKRQRCSTVQHGAAQHEPSTHGTALMPSFRGRAPTWNWWPASAGTARPQSRTRRSGDRQRPLQTRRPPAQTSRWLGAVPELWPAVDEGRVGMRTRQRQGQERG